MMRLAKYLILLYCLLSPIYILVNAEEEDVGAKVVLYVEKDENDVLLIPSIQVSNWTLINLTLIDMYDFNWTELLDRKIEKWINHRGDDEQDNRSLSLHQAQ